MRIEKTNFIWAFELECNRFFLCFVEKTSNEKSRLLELRFESKDDFKLFFTGNNIHGCFSTTPIRNYSYYL